MNNKPLILVVEDEKLLLEAITKKLAMNGIDTISCTTGEQAIEYSKNNANQIVDAMWLDFQLPDMDGITLLSKIREKDEWKEVPVIVVSNSASDEKVNGMLALGAKRYLLKAEHRLEDIINDVRNIIKSTQN
jgi:DNA-binding response OmpR family regulator